MVGVLIRITFQNQLGNFGKKSFVKMHRSQIDGLLV